MAYIKVPKALTCQWQPPTDWMDFRSTHQEWNHTWYWKPSQLLGSTVVLHIRKKSAIYFHIYVSYWKILLQASGPFCSFWIYLFVYCHCVFELFIWSLNRHMSHRRITKSFLFQWLLLHPAIGFFLWRIAWFPINPFVRFTCCSWCWCSV